ncbi:hydroxyproline-rich glycoprotein family protein [Wolffia australiana]
MGHTKERRFEKASGKGSGVNGDFVFRVLFDSPVSPSSPKSSQETDSKSSEASEDEGDEVGGGTNEVSAMAFSFSQQQQGFSQSPFQFNVQQPQAQLQMQQPQSQLQMQLAQQSSFLSKADKSPATYNTKWEELHADSQKYLLEIEARILEYRSESQRLDQCSRLSDSSITNNGFEVDASRIIQELGGISIAIDREKNSVQGLMASAKEMMRNTEFAVRSFMIIHPRFIHQSSAASNGSGGGGQPTPVVGPAQDFYSGVPKRPSPFFVNTVAQFERYLSECQLWIEELEQLLKLDKADAFSSPVLSLESLPAVLSNVYDYFIYTAAKVESIHQFIESMKTAYLADQRRRGDLSDPFLEADRRETAKLEAAAKRVHPTLHLPAAAAAASAGAPAPTPAAAHASSLFATPAPAAPPGSTASPPPANTPLFSVPSFASGTPLGSGASFGGTSKNSKPKSRTSRR